MNKLRFFLFTLVSCACTLAARAQEGGILKQEEPTDFMRSNGKIFVVVAVIVIILGGLFAYLYNLDKKITALEKGSRK